MAACKVCGTAHASCGPSTVGTVVPIDERVTLRKEGGMADLKRYNVQIPGRHGRFTETTLLLSDEDAKTQGLGERDLAGKEPPANKAGSAQANKGRARAPRAPKAPKEPTSASTPAASTPPAAPANAPAPAGTGEGTPA